jgi:hypothetical protein
VGDHPFPILLFLIEYASVLLLYWSVQYFESEHVLESNVINCLLIILRYKRCIGWYLLLDEIVVAFWLICWFLGAYCPYGRQQPNGEDDFWIFFSTSNTVLLVVLVHVSSWHTEYEYRVRYSYKISYRNFFVLQLIMRAWRRYTLSYSIKKGKPWCDWWS